MSSKKGNPLDSLKPRNLPKLNAAVTAPQDNSTAAQSNSCTIVGKLTKEPTRSSNVTLPESMWAWIDDRHREVQRSGWHAMRKAAVMRAVLQVAMTVEVDLSGATSEEEVAQRLKRAIVGLDN